MKRILFNTFFPLLILLSCQSVREEAAPLADRDPVNSLIWGQEHIFSSRIMDEDRPIIIALPKGYEESAANYPVLYLTDGRQNIWHAIGSAEVLTRTGNIPPLIIVGIESTNRSRDFSPTVADNWPGSGGGPKFLDFIENELIPFIDGNYRTHPFRVLAGHSLGGLFTASALINRPELFDAHIIMSPSFWWNEQEIVGRAADFFQAYPTLGKSIFFGIGTLESGTEQGMRKELQNFVDVLRANQPEKLRFEHRELENEGHMSSPLLSNYYGLKFIFSDMKVPDTLFSNYSNKAFLQHENSIRAKYGQDAKQSAESYVQIAFNLRDEGNLSGAITVLKRSIEAYPFDIHLMNFLANAYELDHKIDAAIAIYQQAIATSEKYNYQREEEFAAQIKRLTDM